VEGLGVVLVVGLADMAVLEVAELANGQEDQVVVVLVAME
jgi:hypothetical protein